MRRAAQRRRKGTRKRKLAMMTVAEARRLYKLRGRPFPRKRFRRRQSSVVLKPPYKGTWFTQTYGGMWHPVKVPASGKLPDHPNHIKYAVGMYQVCRRKK